MKLLVFPEARRQQVEAVVRETLGESGGTDELTLIIVRMVAPPDWAVHASGLQDPVLEATYCDVIRAALRQTRV